ncbi:hypothetical protein B0H10DRAFT_1094019 [Mycena sp. CBHHK59/15]|nr:hypothetical protein B0H10DRAFT_1094019 [Mycena sp. CBHHK59/15]
MTAALKVRTCGNSRREGGGREAPCGHNELHTVEAGRRCEVQPRSAIALEWLGSAESVERRGDEAFTWDGERRDATGRMKQKKSNGRGCG